MNDENDNDIEDDRFFRTTPNHGSNSRKDNRYNNDRSSSRRRGASAALRYHRDNVEEEKDTDRYRNLNPNHSLRERSDTSYFSEDYDDDSHRRDSRNRDTSRHYEERSFRESSSNGNRSDRRRRHSKDYYYTTSSSDDDHNDKHGPNPNDDHDETEVQNPIEPKEWPPSFQENGSAFVFDVRSAMFYERLSDFFYDPKSKLYYGNKKCAYFRYDDTKEPPFVEVQKMTTEQVEEQRSSGGIAQEKVAPPLLKLKAVGLSKPKIAIKFRTKKVKSSVAVSTLSSREAATTTTVSVSKAKQQQIANIGKWNEQQAELKQQQGVVDPNPSVQGSTLPLAPSKIKTTIKGEPICLVCKKKFPNLAKLRLHEKGSELHKKNLLKLEETRKQKKLSAAAASAASAATAGTKRKLGEAATAILAIDHSASTSTATAATTTATTTSTSTSTTMSTAMAIATTVYTDRAERRRQLHGADLGGPQSLLRFEPLIPATPQQSLGQTPPRTDLLDDETNVGHQMLQKMGYTTNQQQKEKPNSSRISSSSATNKHLRKEWDRIEAMAQKSVPRYR
jgi:hypothetical protein